MKKTEFLKIFASFDEKTIFHFWNDSKTLLELAIKLGLKKKKHLIRMDYEYIEFIKNTIGNESIVTLNQDNGTILF